MPVAAGVQGENAILGAVFWGFGVDVGNPLPYTATYEYPAVADAGNGFEILPGRVVLACSSWNEGGSVRYAPCMLEDGRMNRVFLLAILVGSSMSVLLAKPAGAYAVGPFDFVFTAPGGDIGDERLEAFPLFMDAGHLVTGTLPLDFIASLELEITGLTHSAPMDLDIYLINPFGDLIEIMTDLGGTTGIADVDLIFRDTATGIPGTPIVSSTDGYQPEGLFNGVGDDLGFQTYVGKSGGANAWNLLVIDDAPGDTGMFESFTLRGTVPEPMTLSLLALGALVALRRRRRQVSI